MYLYTTITDKKQIIQQPIFDGHIVNKEKVVKKISEVQVWASSFTDEGDDYCELRVIGLNGNILRTQKVDGY